MNLRTPQSRVENRVQDSAAGQWPSVICTLQQEFAAAASVGLNPLNSKGQNPKPQQKPQKSPKSETLETPKPSHKMASEAWLRLTCRERVGSGISLRISRSSCGSSSRALEEFKARGGSWISSRPSSTVLITASSSSCSAG